MSLVAPSSKPLVGTRAFTIIGVLCLIPLFACQTDESGLNTSNPSQISTWEYKANGGSQVMHSLKPAEISGAKGIFPKGLFAKSTTIMMEAGECLLGDDQYQEMMLNFHPAEAGRGNAVVVRPKALAAGGGQTKGPKSFYLEIPIPTPSSVSLTHSLKNLVVVYRAYDASKGKMEVGIIPASRLKIKGNFVSFKAKLFGAYQAVKLLEAAPQQVKTPSDKAVRSLAGKVLIRSANGPSQSFAKSL